MSAIARESFAQLLEEIDYQEQRQHRGGKKPSLSSQQQQQHEEAAPGKGWDATSLASLAWGLHRAGYCRPVLLDAMALLLTSQPTSTSMSCLDPTAALYLLEASCMTARSR